MRKWDIIAGIFDFLSPKHYLTQWMPNLAVLGITLEALNHHIADSYPWQ